MKALARAARDRRKTLPFRFTPGLNVPVGALVVLIAAPGAGKSFLSLNWAWDMVKAGYPVLYHSPDTPLNQQAQRFMALYTGEPIDKIDMDRAAKVLSEMTFFMRWSDIPCSVDTFTDLVEAENEYLGQPPTLIIVDIVQDLVQEDGPEAYSTLFNTLHRTAHKFKSTVLAVHHTNSNKPELPPTMNDDRYKAGARRAEVMLGLSQPNGHQLRLDILKNRGGEHGKSYYLPFHPERGQVA